MRLLFSSRIIVPGLTGMLHSVCIISLIRIFTLAARLKSYDSSWNIGPATWSVIEIHTAISCSCLMTMRPLFRRIIPWLGGATSSQSDGIPNDQNVPTISSGPSQYERALEAQRRESFASTDALSGNAAVSPQTSWAADPRAASDARAARHEASKSSRLDEEAAPAQAEAGKYIYVLQTF